MWSKRNALLLFILLSSLAAVSHAKSARFSSWYVYWDAARVEAATSQYLPRLDHIGVFGAYFDSKGRLVPSFGSLPDTLASIKSRATNGQKIFLTAVNDVRDDKLTKQKDPAVIQDIISDDARTDAHIRELLDLAAGFDGIEIDYEALRQADRDNFTRFIQRLSQETRRNRKLLSVVVEPKTAEIRSNGAGAVDWTQIARSADRIKIMAYYLHYPGGEPGPVAPAKWVEDVARFALTQIPKEKLAIILAVNGVDWSDKDKDRTIDYESAMALAKEKGVRVKRDKKSGALHFRYADKGARHEVWLEDTASLTEKRKMLEGLGITRIGLWRLGSGDPAFWETLPQR